MSAILLILALAALAASGFGAAVLRATPATGPTASIGQWFASLTGRRALGAGLVAAGVVLFVLVLILRP